MNSLGINFYEVSFVNGVLLLSNKFTIIPEFEHEVNTEGTF